MLSRNFRLQAVGDIDWLFGNYDFSLVSRGLDELLIVDVSRNLKNVDAFCRIVQDIARRCFIPLTVGGGITSIEIARKYIQSGADKLLVNSAFHADSALCTELAANFGRQCIIAGIDVQRSSVGHQVKVDNGATVVDHPLEAWVEHVQNHGAGEILFQSIDQDGTGMGLNTTFFDELRGPLHIPCIVMGGVGTAEHILSGLKRPGIDAVATANLFNFIGTTFLDVRASLVESGVEVPTWKEDEFENLSKRFARA